MFYTRVLFERIMLLSECRIIAPDQDFLSIIHYLRASVLFSIVQNRRYMASGWKSLWSNYTKQAGQWDATCTLLPRCSGRLCTGSWLHKNATSGLHDYCLPVAPDEILSVYSCWLFPAANSPSSPSWSENSFFFSYIIPSGECFATHSAGLNRHSLQSVGVNPLPCQSTDSRLPR